MIYNNTRGRGRQPLEPPRFLCHCSTLLYLLYLRLLYITYFTLQLGGGAIDDLYQKTAHFLKFHTVITYQVLVFYSNCFEFLFLQYLTTAVRVQRSKCSFSRKCWTHPQGRGSTTVVTMATCSVASSAVSWAVTVTASGAIATAAARERAARPTFHWARSVWHQRLAGLPWIQRYATYSQ